MKKRIISILLAVVMVMGLLPVSVFAEVHDSSSEYFTNDFFDWKDLKVYTDDDGDITGISAAAWYNFNQADCIKDRDIGFYVVETTVDPVERLYEKGNLGVVQFDAVMENVGKRIDKGKSDGVRQWVTFSLTADECAGMTRDKEYNIWIWTRSGDPNTENSFESKMGTMTAITINRYVRLDGGTGSAAADYVPDRTINSMNIKGQKLSAAWKTYGAGVLNTSLSNEEAITSSNTTYNLYFDLDSDSLPAAPQLSVTEPTDDHNNDGTITVVDYADGDTIEYSADGINWTDVSGSVIDNLAPGEYSVRRKATEDAPGSKSAVATLILHDHNFTYAANGNQIVATCDGIEGGHTTTLKLNAEESVQYTEDPYEGASISGWSVFYSALAAAPAISYVGRDGTIYEESTTAPTEVGTYTARITLSNVPMTSGGTGDVTATADFEIVDIPTIARLVTSEGVTVSVENDPAYPWDFCADDPKGIQSTNQNIDNSTSTITFTFTSPKDFEFSYKYRVSSETNYDKLTIKLDDVPIVNGISGTAATAANEYSSILSAGTHTLTAFYKKDVSQRSGDDTAYITDIAAYYHSFTYGVDESTPSVLTATCAGRRCCGGYHTTPLTLTLNGKDFNQTELAAWKDAGAAEPVIKYYKSDDTQHSTAVKLTEPGSYVAVATIGEGESAVSVSAEFELTEKDFGIITKNIITNPDAAAEAGVTVHNVTWDDTEDCAVFSGNSSYLEIPSELARIDASNGFVISTEVWIDTDIATWGRIFDFNSSQQTFFACVPKSDKGYMNTDIKFNGAQTTFDCVNPSPYLGKWVKLIWVVRSDGSVRLYHDDTGDANCIAQTGGTATTKKLLTDNTSYTTCYLGNSAWKNNYFKGKMRSFTLEPIVHNFAYGVDENDASVLTATCSGENCYAQHDAGTPSISLTLTLNGKDFDAAELAAWISAGAAEPVIKYYKSDDTERSTAVGLTGSGSYVAVATVGTATAEKAFTITMATEDTTTTGTYQPTNIINGGFDDCPWMGFKISSTVYTKEDLIAGHHFTGGSTLSSLIYNGPNEGWNTTAMRVFDDGKLFDWTKKQMVF